MVIIVEVDPDEASLFEDIIDLGNLHRNLLGFIPRGAIRDLAKKGRLLAAVDGSELVGYVLYDVARMRVRLIHLCVDKERRSAGIAKLLVDHLSKLHSDLPGIAVTCRRDYEATRVWPKLGFEYRTERPGRGRDRAILINWWRDNGLPDLFSQMESEEKTTVVIDRNIIIDLTFERNRAGAEQSLALEADWLSEEIQLAITPEAKNEIVSIEDASERDRHRLVLGRFHDVTFTPEEWNETEARFLGEINDMSRKDAADRRHIIGAAAGGARVFVTRDEQLIRRYADIAADALGLKILLPSELVAELDEVINSVRYRPVDLNGTEIKMERFGAGAEVQLDQLQDYANGESKPQYRQLIRRLVVDSDASRWWIHNKDDKVVATWATRESDNDQSLEVPLFRFSKKGALGMTIGRLLIFKIKQEAVASKRISVRITDPYIPHDLRASLVSDGFVDTGQGIVATVVKAYSRTQLLGAVSDKRDFHDHVRQITDRATTPAQFADAERLLWPTKFLESGLFNYLIPVRRAWADDLLRYQETLFHRPLKLGISRELVYYRTPVNSPRAPARIIWYVSGTDKRGVGAAVASSQLIQVETGLPGHLHRRYQHLGVYRLQGVEDLAHGGFVEALKFSDTEIFEKPIPLERIRKLSKGRLTSTLQSPTRIDSELWGKIYREGTEPDD